MLISIDDAYNRSKIKLLFSNIKSVSKFKTPINLVAFIYDSNVEYIEPKCLDINNTIELNLFNFTTDSFNFQKLINSSKLKLLNLRNTYFEISNTIKIKDINPASIDHLSIFSSFIPILNDSFLMFNIINNIQQLELVGCQIEKIENFVFDRKTFLGLKVLTLTNNKISIITEKTFKGLHFLKILDLDENPISFIHELSFLNLPFLEILSLNNIRSINLITKYPIWINNLINSSYIKEINLINNYWLIDKCSVIFFLNLIETLRIKNIYDYKSYVKIRIFPNRFDKIKSYNRFKNDDFICNVAHICNNKELSKSWRVEKSSFCSKFVNKNVNSNCLLREKFKNCNISVHFDSKPASQINKRSSILIKIKYIVISSGAVILVLIIFIFLYFLFSFSNSNKSLKCKHKRNNRKLYFFDF
jgi:hypothetical protein